MTLDTGGLGAWVAAHRSEINEYHKIQELSFRPLSVDPEDVTDLPGVLVYESRPESAPRPSRYFIAEIDGEIAWVRVADHWGHFTVYRSDLDREMPYNWVLTGSRAETEPHEAGFVLVGYVAVASLKV